MKQDLKNNAKIKLGKVELPEGFEERENHKYRITAWIDGDLYDELRKRAASGEGNGKYQTLMNELLREKLFPESPITETYDGVYISTAKLHKFIKEQQRAYSASKKPTKNLMGKYLGLKKSKGTTKKAAAKHR